MLLYLVKYSRPDIANAVRELSKALDSPSPGAFKEMLRVVKFVLDTKNFGHEKAIQEAINDLKNEGFDLTLYETLDDYLSCEISFDRKKNMAWIHQSYLITKLIKKFGEHTKGLQVYKIPGTPGFGTLRNPKGVVDPENHKIYRSGVGMLLYFVKYSRPHLANAVRELSKALDSPSSAAYKEML